MNKLLQIKSPTYSCPATFFPGSECCLRLQKLPREDENVRRVACNAKRHSILLSSIIRGVPGKIVARHISSLINT
jgi:hypothetical protein